MPLPGQSLDRTLPSYDFARQMGQLYNNDIDFKAFADRLDCQRDLYGVGIIYAEGKQRWLVRPSRRIGSDLTSVSHVVVTKVESTTRQPAEKAMLETVSAPSLATEIGTTALSCGAMVVTLLMTIGAGMTVPFTAGGTGIFVGISAAGTVATGAQCFIGAARLYAIHEGHGSDVVWLDSQDWYIATTTALDVISMAAAGTALAKTLKIYKTMRGATQLKAIDWLKSLPREERKRITEDIIRARNPGISNAGVKAAIRSGSYPKRFPSEDLQRTLQRALIDAAVNASAFAGSAAGGTIRNPQNIPTTAKYAFGLIQSFSPF
ncbi:hypothetical protein [Metakosakonia massiliensis]|uniref:NAD synthetase n=1 Tax=Phytobacter massiliensis TaxID=1485952 RepID=A0A6N3HUJ6_9ENTR|nr:hypothetical protein [Phytobacter massiliensis]